jgi:hypothetical protein
MPEITIEMEKTADPGQTTTQVGVPSDGAAADTTVQFDAESTIVPIVLFLAVALTFCVRYYFAHRTRQETQNTVRVALERGQPLSPELLDRLGQSPPPKRNDLRRGVVGVCLGIGLAAFGLVLGQEDAVRPMLAVAMVPLLLGLAYLVLWRLNGDKA